MKLVNLQKAKYLEILIVLHIIATVLGAAFIVINQRIGVDGFDGRDGSGSCNTLMMNNGTGCLR